MATDINEEFFEGLTMKEKLFVAAYFKNDYNASKAIIEAGYKTKYPNKMGTQLKQRPHVKAAIDALGQKKMDEVSVSPEYVLRKLIRTVEKAEQQENHGATLRGLELLAKHLGMFIERQEISGPDGGAIVHEQKVKQGVEDFTKRLKRLERADDAPNVISIGSSKS